MKPAFWFRHRFVVLLAACVALAATFTHTPRPLEDLAYAYASRFASEDASPTPVAVVAIDEKSLRHYGSWPWPRSRLAAVVDRLDAMGVRAIGLMLPLGAPQTPPTLGALRQEIGKRKGKKPQVQVIEALNRLDTDRTLAGALARADKVVIAAGYRPAARPEPLPSVLQHAALRKGAAPIPWYLLPWRWLLQPPGEPPIRVRAPIAPLSAAAAGIGLTPSVRPDDRMLGVPLAVRADGRELAGFVLRLAAVARGVAQNRIAVLPGRGVRAGRSIYTTAPDLMYYPRPLRAAQGRGAIAVYSLSEVLGGRIPAAHLNHKTVLIGFTAPGLAPRVAGPGGVERTPVGWNAQALAALLSGNGITVPFWFYGAQRGLIILLALYLLVLPAGLRGRAGLLLSLALSLVIVNAGLAVLISRLVWLPVILPAAFLLAAHTVLALRQRLENTLVQARSETAEARRLLAVNLQAQGQLDQAFEQLRRCPGDAAVLEPLYELGLEYERRRQFPKALSVYDHLVRQAPSYRDIQSRREHLKTVASHLPRNGNAGAAATGTVVLDHPGVEKPILGRYQLVRELGRGAMGVVYLGTDPKIGREVAIKTLALTQEFEGGALQEARQRFIREAEAAGRLDHPNIVTIHDVGEEHDLAYIAMDYARGDSLLAYSEPGQLLPLDEVLEVCAQVADALDYAHGRKVIHRDIKPGNIIYDRDNGVVKVSDFGVASLTDDSRTRTGTVLGSPSYMSPEQVTGKKLDGRSDLFSLGVTLYQMAAGQVPFAGDSLANLSYRIGHEKHPSIAKFRRGLPACLGRIINKALQKVPAKRFQSGAEMAAALRRCRTKV